MGYKTVTNTPVFIIPIPYLPQFLSQKNLDKSVKMRYYYEYAAVVE